MKLAVLADIHGNWPALEAVAEDIRQWQPDMVLVNGDIVNGGPSNVVCWRYIQERQARDGWVVLRGNHEDYVAAWDQPDQPLQGPLFELSRFSHWTYHQMNGDIAGLVTLPEQWEWVAPDGTRLVAMHASRLGNRAGIYPHTTDADARRMVDLSADVFVTSHTHVTHQRRIDQTAVLNTGSVGLSGDGDRRAAYGRLLWDGSRGWRMEFKRVAYDMAATERAYTASGFLTENGPLALMTLVELRSARDAKTRWSAIYREAVVRGQITVEEAVQTFLDTPEFRPYVPRETRFILESRPLGS